MKQIKLVNSKRVALVDDDDYPFLSEYKWHLRKLRSKKRSHKIYNYVRTCFFFLGKQYKPNISRVITNAPIGFDVDHKNGDGLDNRKINLRVATRTENARNSAKPKRFVTSKFKGVAKERGRWRARIYDGKKRQHLGLFKIAKEAAVAYDAAARKLFGLFARTNFP